MYSKTVEMHALNGKWFQIRKNNNVRSGVLFRIARFICLLFIYKSLFCILFFWWLVCILWFFSRLIAKIFDFSSFFLVINFGLKFVWTFWTKTKRYYYIVACFILWCLAFEFWFLFTIFRLNIILKIQMVMITYSKTFKIGLVEGSIEPIIFEGLKSFSDDK